MSHFDFEAIGTHWEISIFSDMSSGTLDTLEQAIRARIVVFDKHYSRFRNDSLVADMSRVAGNYTLPDDAKPMMDLYEALYAKTEGRITPLIGQVLADAGYDAEYSLSEKEMHPAPRWEDVLDYEFPQLVLGRPVLLDFGSLGKGYLIDIIGEIIRETGAQFLINAGGDMLYHRLSGEVLRVGLENPNDFSEVVGVVELKSGSLCGSSGSRRKWGRFHHIIDPQKLESPKEILATWTTAKTALLADACATALFFVKPKALTGIGHFEYLVLHEDMNIEKSPAFPAEVFYK